MSEPVTLFDAKDRPHEVLLDSDTGRILTALTPADRTWEGWPLDEVQQLLLLPEPHASLPHERDPKGPDSTRRDH